MFSLPIFFPSIVVAVAVPVFAIAAGLTAAPSVMA
jgi:hypothetical protein